MKVYVLVPMIDGIVHDVVAFRTSDSAAAAEQTWLCVEGILDQKERERRSDWGTGIAVWECELPD